MTECRQQDGPGRRRETRDCDAVLLERSLERLLDEEEDERLRRECQGSRDQLGLAHTSRDESAQRSQRPAVATAGNGKREHERQDDDRYPRQTGDEWRVPDQVAVVTTRRPQRTVDGGVRRERAEHDRRRTARKRGRRPNESVRHATVISSPPTPS